MLLSVSEFNDRSIILVNEIVELDMEGRSANDNDKPIVDIVFFSSVHDVSAVCTLCG
jgi:hypothetical protein